MKPNCRQDKNILVIPNTNEIEYLDFFWKLQSNPNNGIKSRKFHNINEDPSKKIHHYSIGKKKY